MKGQKKFTVKAVCEACKGTGIYQGFAEKPGAGVICHDCKGTGCFSYSYTYREFEARVVRKDIKRVFQANPGICIGGNTERFGGISYKDWLAGKRFKKGTEMRKYTCPAWWAQSVGQNKPYWKRCKPFMAFSSCPSFKRKASCWEMWDRMKKRRRDSKGRFIAKKGGK